VRSLLYSHVTPSRADPFQHGRTQPQHRTGCPPMFCRPTESAERQTEPRNDRANILSFPDVRTSPKKFRLVFSILPATADTVLGWADLLAPVFLTRVPACAHPAVLDVVRAGITAAAS
jgi:hypothetical protein